VYGPASVVNRWRARQEQISAVSAGDEFVAGGYSISVHGDLHAPIHRDLPRVANVGYLIDETLYHPGNAYHAPTSPVHTLLLPMRGPWTKLGEAVDFLRSVNPERSCRSMSSSSANSVNNRSPEARRCSRTSS